MKKTLLISIFAAALTALSIQVYAQNSKVAAPAAPAPAVKTASPASEPATTAPASAESKKPVTTRKFGPGVTQIPKGESAQSLGVSSSKLLIAMIVVVAAMGGFFWVLKKFNSRLNNYDKSSSLRVKSRIQLDSKNAVVLIGVYEQEFLVGAGTNGVTLISKFSSIEDGAGLTDDEAQTNADDAKSDNKDVSFSEKLLSYDISPVESSNLKKINGEK